MIARPLKQHCAQMINMSGDSSAAGCYAVSSIGFQQGDLCSSCSGVPTLESDFIWERFLSWFFFYKVGQFLVPMFDWRPRLKAALKLWVG